MIITDKLLANLEKNKKPIRVGLVGAGFMGKGIILQLVKYSNGINLVAVSNRTLKKAVDALKASGVKKISLVKTTADFNKSVNKNIMTVTDNPYLLCRSRQIDVIVEATGNVELGAKITLEAIKNKKHIVLMNAELDGTVGPILKTYADRAGVVYTNADGDQPGVIMDLYRFVKGIGLSPVLCGNIKGLHDPYRNPTTQIAYARKWGQKPEMVASFADGTKISFEQAIVANATGMSIAKRGMTGKNVKGDHVDNAAKWFDGKYLLTGPGIVDYAVNAKPAPGVFVIATTKDPVQRNYLNLYKLGKGPYYVFYTPYHLCHFEVPNTIARAYLFWDATLSPIGKPYCDVIAIAKKDLKKGETIDQLGGFCSYGVIEKAKIVYKQKLLPIGLAKDCVLKRDINRDSAIYYKDVILPGGRLSDKLREEQNKKFFKATL